MSVDSDDHCSRISGLIFRARSDLHFYETIAEYASQIKAKQYSRFFGSIQQMGLRSALIGICSIYEFESDRNPSLSIHALCKAIRQERFQKGREQFLKDLKGLGIVPDSAVCDHRTDRQVVDECIGAIIDQLYPTGKPRDPPMGSSPELVKIRGWLGKAKDVRSRLIAHASARPDVENLRGPSLEGMDELLKWAERFIQFVRVNFADPSVSEEPNQNAETVRASIVRALEGLSIIAPSSICS